MPRLFVGNYDFEHHLGRHAAPASARLQRLNDELASAWLAVADDGDYLWTPSAVEPGFFEQAAACGLAAVNACDDDRRLPDHVELCPWGWTQPLRDWAERRGWRCGAPSQDVVRDLNSRRFSFALEQEWGRAPPGAAIITDLAQLTPALRNLPAGSDRWVLKAEFGMSARERVLGSGAVPSEAVIGWARRRIAAGIVFLEPWLERIDEVGIQITVPPITDGQSVLEGLTPLLTDRSGAYRGSRFGLDESLRSPQWQPAVDAAMQAAERMQRAGYFGSLGIDAMRFRDHDGQFRLRPLQDINARWTMGRLALGLRRLLKPGEVGTWLHLRWSGASLQENRRRFDEVAARLPATVRVVPTSPFEIAGLPVSHGTAAVIAASPADLATAESLLWEE